MPGCSTSAPEPSAYVTISDEPGRNTSAAAALSLQGAQQILANDLSEAEKTLRRALEADPACGPAHNNLGLLYLKRNEMYKAAWEFQYASQLMPKNAEPIYNQGFVFEQSSRYFDAILKYEEAHKISPQNPVYLGNLVRARIRRGDQDKSLLTQLEILQRIETRSQWLDWEHRQILSLRAFLAAQIADTKPSSE